MQVNGQHYLSIWFDTDSGTVRIIDQTRLPHHFEIRSLDSLQAAGEAGAKARRNRGTGAL